jgi:hypothetical protein
MIRNIGFLFGLAACLALPGAAGAQNPQPAQPHEPHPSVAPPNAPQPPPERIAPRDSAPGTAGRGSFSDRLSQQQGTLRPPAVDPGIHAPLPADRQETMPVIPPPGTPGGNRDVVPK